MTSAKEHQHHTFKKIFKKDTSPSDKSSGGGGGNSFPHVGLSKIFHKDSPAESSISGKDAVPIAQSPNLPKRTPSAFSLKRRNTNPVHQNSSASDNRSRSNSEAHHLHHPQPHSLSHAAGPVTHKKLTKAETFAHLQQLDSRNAAKQQLRNNRVPSIHNSGGTGTGGPANSPSLPNHEKIVYNPYGMNKSPSQEQPRNASFYLSGVVDGERVLANPVANPNDYLPAELRQKHVNLLEDFEIDVGTKKLGDGGSSDVRIINSINHKKNLYALKKFTLLSKETDEDFYKRVSKEYAIHKMASASRHVVDVMAILRIQSQANLTRGWGVVMEFCSGGDLFSLITRPGWKSSPLNEKYCLFKQIAYGLKFIHEQDVAHRDLKPENVLLDANGVAKLCDFGVSDFGHTTPGDFESPIKMSSSYVGSPPYSPPEVMLLKEKSHVDAKNFPYDMFKSDCWGLGMILFCLVYAGVPFQQATTSDYQYREYQFNHKRFSSDHQNFKNNKGINKGPGSEFKLAAKFESTGASRVAWKLCDPSINTRYTITQLMEDPWFTGLEMCIYEDPDQEVNPFVLPGTGENIPSLSTTSSAANSQAPSRRATLINKNVYNQTSSGENGYESSNDEINNNNNSSNNLAGSFRSMLDLNDASERIIDHGNNYNTNKKTTSVSSSSASLHSNDGAPSNSVSRVRSMLDVGQNANGAFSPASPYLQYQQDQQPQQQQLHSSPNGNLFALEESDIEHEPECVASMKQDELEQQQQQQQEQQPSPSSLTHIDHVGDVNSGFKLPPKRIEPESEVDSPHSDEGSIKSLYDIKPKVSRTISDIKIESDGTCPLGYKLKRHHHNEVSNVTNKAVPRR
ncbi:PTK2 [Candida oxycetoniae]|uniref:non-specific serine/threonine protein kinase n=1 Tax=Candida oxycetoniae TaxID=497107 RepID=A0AAI9WXP4_9ASCO|nr:PTK2 [Candida oxycetoniae]KAI3404214.2 PTK2 [Candida oxycetoniae]